MPKVSAKNPINRDFAKKKILKFRNSVLSLVFDGI
jgi:hypothetical protein